MWRTDSWKDPDAGKDWRWEEKGTTEDEVVGWHHRLNGHVFQSTLVVGVGKEMATHYSILAWRALWTEEPGGLLSMRLHRVRHAWSDLAYMHALEKEMVTHSSILSWRIPSMEEPGGLLSVGSHRVRHYWSDLAATAAAAGSWWWMGKPGILQYMGLQRVGHHWVTELNWCGNMLRF